MDYSTAWVVDLFYNPIFNVVILVRSPAALVIGIVINKTIPETALIKAYIRPTAMYVTARSCAVVQLTIAFYVPEIKVV